MKLRIVKASSGLQWFRMGLRTFMRRPMAITGLFFINITVLSLLAQIPLLGIPLALMLVPASTVAMMVAAEQAHEGRFPMPDVILAGFRGGARLTRTLLILGCVYSVGMFVALGASALADGGQLASLYLEGGQPTEAQAQDPSLLLAMLVMVSLLALLSMLLWHAPALAYWHGVGPAKSLFFSMVACLRNFAAFTLYTVAWIGLVLLAIFLALMVAQASGSMEMFLLVLYPAVMLISAMLLTSVYFTFRDCFQSTPEGSP